MFNVMVMSPLVEDVVDSLVGWRSESLYTAGATLRHEIELRMIRGERMYFIS